MEGRPLLALTVQTARVFPTLSQSNGIFGVVAENCAAAC